MSAENFGKTPAAPIANSVHTEYHRGVGWVTCPTNRMGRSESQPPTGPVGKADREPHQMDTMNDTAEPVNPDVPTEADRQWWAGETRSDDWQDDWRWELGPGADDEPTDADWDEWAGQ